MKRQLHVMKNSGSDKTRDEARNGSRPDLFFLWFLGFTNLIFSAAGLFAAAGALILPLSLGAAAFDVNQEAVLWLLAYASPVWAPIGAGMGLFTAMRLIKGMRRSVPHSN
jgi:hypothetical protein